MAKPDKPVSKNLACKIFSLQENDENNEAKINQWLMDNKNKEIVDFVSIKYFLIISYQK